MLPFTPIAVRRRMEQMAQLVKGDDKSLKNAADTFAICDALTVKIEAADGAPEYVLALALYTQSRTGDLEQDWQLFGDLIGGEAITLWWQAYTATRATALSADPAVQAGKPEGKAADPQR